MTRTQGLADAGADRIAPALLAAWDAFLASAAVADLTDPIGQSGCVRLGLWSEHWTVHDLIGSARSGRIEPLPSGRDIGAAHQNAARDEVLAALRRHRDAVSLFFASTDRPPDNARAASPLGRLPLLSLLFGQAYELAGHALDLVECGAPEPPEHLLDTGVGALAELLGALAAEAGLGGSFAFRSESGTWSVHIDEDGWTTSRPTATRLGGAVLEGTAADLLAAAAGRADPATLLTARRLRGQALGGLLRLAPLVDIPGVPGAALLALR